MAMIDILDMCWQARASDQNQAQLVNMYLEVDPAKGKYQGGTKTPIVNAYPMSGLTLFSTISGAGVVRYLYELNGVVFVIAGNQFGAIAADGTYTQLGTLNTSTGWAKIRAITGGADTNNQVVMADGTNIYTYNVGANVFTTPQNTSFVSAVNMADPGSGYSNPVVTFTDATGTGATAVANLTAGTIDSITVTDGGSGYTAPSVVITDSTGTGADAVALLLVSSCPNTADDIENQDDYIIAKIPNSQQFNICNPSDSTIWNPLMFASKFGQPDHITGILSHEAALWLFGDKTTEIWTDTGVTGATAFFPFSRSSIAFLHYGSAAKQSIVTNGNYFIFLSTNNSGGSGVFQTLPRIYYYNPSPVSTPPIDEQIAAMPTISDAIGAIHNINNHEFYHLTFPTGNKTFVYDIPKAQQADQQKGLWYYRQSNVGGVYGRFRENCACFCYGKHIVGDYASGNVYYLDNLNYTENGTPILRQFTSPPGETYAGGKRVFFPRLQIDVETGIGSSMQFTVEKSGDNGGTWQTLGTYTVPPKGGRIFITRVGSSRYGMLFRVSTTMNAKFCILGFQAEMLIGHS